MSWKIHIRIEQVCPTDTLEGSPFKTSGDVENSNEAASDDMKIDWNSIFLVFKPQWYHSDITKPGKNEALGDQVAMILVTKGTRDHPIEQA